VVRAALRSLSDLLCSHRSHPNQKRILNNKDRKDDYNKGEAGNEIHGLFVSPDYRRKRQSVKGEFFRFGEFKRLHFVFIENHLFPLTNPHPSHRIAPNMQNLCFGTMMTMTTTSGTHREAFVLGQK